MEAKSRQHVRQTNGKSDEYGLNITKSSLVYSKRLAYPTRTHTEEHSGHLNRSFPGPKDNIDISNIKINILNLPLDCPQHGYLEGHTSRPLAEPSQATITISLTFGLKPTEKAFHHPWQREYSIHSVSGTFKVARVTKRDREGDVNK